MLATRYPQLAFLMQMVEKKRKAPLKPLPELKLENKELLYLFGIGHYEKFKSWLHEKEERKLVFVEDDLSALHYLEGEAFLEDPQVHLQFLMEGAPLETFAEELADTYPFDHLEIVQVKESPVFEELALLVKRKTTVHHAIFQERFYYPKLFANLLENFFVIPGSGYINHWENAFSDLPVIVCGAGPSLQSVIPNLKKMRDRALIVAGGTAITALTKAGVVPHLGIAIDPNPEEAHHLKNHQAGDMPLVFCSRLQPHARRHFFGEMVYYRSFTGGPIERWLEEEIGLTDPPLQKTAHKEALSVTTAALNIVAHLGCKEIVLAGVDLAYTGGKRYPDGTLPDSLPEKSMRVRDEELLSKDWSGKEVLTQVKWVMEADWIAAFAKTHTDCRIFSCTNGGLKLDLPYRPLEPNNFPKKTIDIQAQIEKSRLNVDVVGPLQKLHDSLLRCKKLIDEMEGPLYDVALLDLEEELAYPLCFKTFLSALKKKFVSRKKTHLYIKMALDNYINEFAKHERKYLVPQS